MEKVLENTRSKVFCLILQRIEKIEDHYA